MSLKKLRNTFGYLALSIAVVLSTPQIAIAAETSTEVTAAKEREEVTERTTERATEAQTEEATERSTERPTERATEKPMETEGSTDTNATEPTTDGNTSISIAVDDGTTDDGTVKKNDEGEIPDAREGIAPNGDNTIPEDHSDAASDYVANIIAGNGVYLESLAQDYGLTFADDFEEVMNQIEENYREWLDEPEAFVARNWQDVLAVYVLRCQEELGQTSFTLDQDSMEELEKIFFQMNIRTTSSLANKLSTDIDTSQEVYGLSTDEYAELRNLSSAQKELLEKYTSAECKQLSAIVTASTGFVRSQVGEDVSEERIAIVKAACSIIGKVGYFWGGKSYVIGWDSTWGSPRQVTAAGSRSSGTSRGYGLDCSGFVAWAYYNGLNGNDGGIGGHTTTQWNASEMVDTEEAQPGDMVFYNSPAAGDQNHIGIVIGKNADGSMMVVHCSSGRNGVVVGEAWSQGFKYVRSPLSLT